MAILAIFAFSLGVLNVFGAEIGLYIRPVKVSQTINAGESFSGFISLKNVSSSEVKVKISVEDFIPASGSTAYQFVGRAKGNTTVRDWLSFDAPEDFIFKKAEEKNV
ncbi:MAG: hypothetical protein Q8N81_03050, partial [bacterium]|nr:hypothetical protein [bacterium]